MRILHLSDLHVATDISPLIERFESIPEPELAAGFDFAVVSGDLTDQATDDQYARAALFLQRVVGSLTVKDPARVVVVPGDHDMSWCEDFPRGPRFEAFTRFSTEFYSRSPSVRDHRQFRSDPLEPSAHWSVHRFPRAKIAFYGLNTCDGVDRWNRGAVVNARAILDVKSDVAALPPDVVKVGVWHHGVTTGRGAWDHLTFEDLSNLKAAGLEVGIHGHAHQDQSFDLFDSIRERFPLVGTGSFGAELPRRQGAVSGQFSILELSGDLVTWRRWSRQEQPPRWVEVDSRALELRRRGVVRTLSPRSLPRVASNQRRVKIGSDGISDISVVLADVTFDNLLVMASPLAGFTQSDCREARADGDQGHSVTVGREGDPAIFVIDAKGTPTHFDKLEWQYELSNAFAIDGVDACYRKARAKAALKLENDEDAYLYEIDAITDVLDVEVEFPPTTRLKKDEVCAAVQRCVSTSVCRPTWIHDRDETRRLSEALKVPAPNKIAFALARPLPGFRYGVRYRFDDGRAPIEHDVAAFIDRKLTECREGTRAQDLVDILTAAVTAAFETVFRLEPAELPGFWLAHLWSTQKGKLLPAFGRLRNAHWGGSFHYGTGIAGHAFRLAAAAVYKIVGRGAAPQTAPPRTRLLYRRPVLDHKDYDWLIELPILVSETGPAVGVIGFAAVINTWPTTKAEQRLAGIAASVLNDAQSEGRLFLNEITQQASARFWEVLSDDPVGARIYRNFSLRRVTAIPLSPRPGP